MKDPNKDPKKETKEDLQDFLREVQTVARKAFEKGFAHSAPKLLAQFEKDLEEERKDALPFSKDAKTDAQDKLEFCKLFLVLELGLQTEEEAQTLRHFVQLVRKSFLSSFLRTVANEFEIEDAKTLLREALDAVQPFLKQLESLELLPACEKALNAFEKIRKVDKETKDVLHTMATAGRLIENPKAWQTLQDLTQEESKNLSDAWQKILPEMKRRAGI